MEEITYSSTRREEWQMFAHRSEGHLNPRQLRIGIKDDKGMLRVVEIGILPLPSQCPCKTQWHDGAVCE
jgi:hypothetical protein